MHKHKTGNQAREYPKRKATNPNRMMIRESPIRMGHINKHIREMREQQTYREG